MSNFNTAQMPSEPHDLHRRVLQAAALIFVSLCLACGGRQMFPLDGGPRDHPAVDRTLQQDAHFLQDHRSLADAIPPGFHVALEVLYISEDCMPGPPETEDRVGFAGNAQFLNKTAAAVGPITFTTGRVLHNSTGHELATFELNPIVPVVLQPGESVSTKVEKSSNSLKSSGSCQICVALVQIELFFQGAGMTVSKVLSEPVAPSCGI